MKIKSTSQIHQESIFLLVYGESGSGKTTLARTIKRPTLIISAEGGLLSLHGSDIDYVDLTVDDENQPITDRAKRLKKLEEIYRLLTLPEYQKRYEWIYIDSLSEIAQNVVEALRKEFPEGKDALKMWGSYNQKMRGLIKSFRDLPHYNVAMTCLSGVDKDENNQRFTTVDMSGKISTQLHQYFDEVFYLFVKDVESPKGGTARERLLLTEKTETVFAKDRSGRLDRVEPSDLSLVIKKITGEKSR